MDKLRTGMFFAALLLLGIAGGDRLLDRAGAIDPARSGEQVTGKMTGGTDRMTAS